MPTKSSLLAVGRDTNPGASSPAHPEKVRDQEHEGPEGDDGEHQAADGGRGTPSAVAIDASGTIVSSVVAGADAVLALVQGRTAILDPATRQAVTP